jgi:4-amino-4-deoxy-L-arabinose transferase-like glycosyltransferase
MKILKNISKGKIIIFLLVLIVLVIASFFRLWHLNSVPPGLYPDVAINGNDVLDTLQSKNFKLFYPENNGREGVFMWLIALSFTIFGPSVWAIKIVPAIFGILTVLGVYLLTKELFKIGRRKQETRNTEYIALLAAFFLAISFWHVNFSRLGFRALLVPFSLVFAFYFLLKAFNRRSIILAAISGIFFGFGFYTYISYRFVVLIIAAVFICWWLIYKREKLQKKFFLLISSCLLLTFIVALPLGIYFFKNPQDFLGRAAGVSILKTDNPLYEFGKSVILHLSMFNVFGDGNWRHNLSGSPELLWPVGIFFLIGVILSIKELIVSLKNKNYRLFSVYCLLFSWFLAMLLPGFLSYEGIPHALRVIGAIPPVFIFAALGANWIFVKSKPVFKTKKQLIILYFCVSIFLFSLAFAEFEKYFYQWGKNPEVKNAFAKDLFDIGNYLNSLPNNVNKYVIVNLNGVGVPYPNGTPMPAQTPIFIERTMYGNPRATYLTPDKISEIKTTGETIIIPLSYDENLFVKLLEIFPGGKLNNKNGFLIYEIK